MNDTEWLLLSDVARLLRRRPHQIVYLLTSRQVPEPSLRLGNRRIFSAQDVERLRAKLRHKKGVVDE
jgi:DNA-binding transcriptional MerR regulator